MRSRPRPRPRPRPREGRPWRAGIRSTRLNCSVRMQPVSQMPGSHCTTVRAMPCSKRTSSGSCWDSCRQTTSPHWDHDADAL